MAQAGLLSKDANGYEIEQGFRIGLSGVFSLAHVAAGPRPDQTETLGFFDGSVHLDLEPLFQWEGGELKLRAFGVLGEGPSQLIGDDQIIDNVEAESAFYPYEIWLQQRLDIASVRLGLLGLDTEFAYLPLTQLFVHSSAGTPAAFGASGLNGPSIYPTSGLGARLEVHLLEALSLRLGFVDAVPGDPIEQGRFHPVVRVREGALVVSEVALQLGAVDTPSTRVVGGFYAYTEPLSSLRPDVDAPPLGGFVLGEQAILQFGPRRVSVFAQFDLSDGRTNLFELYMGGGLVLDGLTGFGAGDALGVMVASGKYGSGARLLRGSDLGDFEHALELTYRWDMVDGLRLQPVLQHIINPAGQQTSEDAWVVYGRVEVIL